jgi:RNA polymerase sigma-70 factor (ECF subfamily)
MQALDRLKETQLLRRIKGSDEAAFVEAYDLYAPKIYRHALYRTGSSETASDVMGETFLKAWEYFRLHAQEVKNLKAFIYRICNNLVIDHYRRNARAPVPIDEDLERTLGVDAGIVEWADRNMEGERVRKAMCELRVEVREILVMRFIDDLTIEEIAEATGRNRNAVYVAIHRAVKELKIVCSTTISQT